MCVFNYIVLFHIIQGILMYTSPSYCGGDGQLDQESDRRMRGTHSSSSVPADPGPDLELELCALRLR